jgi:hypothetical protein
MAAALNNGINGVMWRRNENSGNNGERNQSMAEMKISAASCQ